MKTNRLTIVLLAMASFAGIKAQTSFDAAKVYEEELNGTARYVGMGGAMSALGSDASVISHNPAGIGTYRQSDINASLSFWRGSVNTDPKVTKSNPGIANGRTFYSKNTEGDFNIGFDNFSAVFSGSESGDNYLNFAFSYRKLQNMNRVVDYYDKFYVPDDSDPSRKYVVYRDFKDSQRNKINSFDFNLSCNLSDKVYVGWTIGFLSTDTWSEGYLYDYYPDAKTASADGEKDFVVPEYAAAGHDYTAMDKMNTADGSGWNMSFGVIIRPVQPLRLGVALKTPTWYRQKLEYSDYLYAFMDCDFKDDNGNVSQSRNSVDYKFSSPWTLNLSAGLTIGQTALGFEYEKHFTQRSSLSIGNTKMESQGSLDYKDYSTIKVGLEQNIGNFSVRGGYNYIEPMFKENAYPYLFDSDFNGWGYDEDENLYVGRGDFQIDRIGKTQYITTGLGYCSEPDSDGTQFYVDLAYIHGIRGSVFNLNEFEEDVNVKYNYITKKVMLTIGFTF